MHPCLTVHRLDGTRLDAGRRFSRPRVPDAPTGPLTTLLSFWGSQVYFGSGQRQGPDNLNANNNSLALPSPQTESEIRGVLGQWKSEARLNRADNREASRKLGLPSGSITQITAPLTASPCHVIPQVFDCGISNFSQNRVRSPEQGAAWGWAHCLCSDRCQPLASWSEDNTAPQERRARLTRQKLPYPSRTGLRPRTQSSWPG